MRVYLYYAGKRRDRAAHALAEEFILRAGRFARCEMRPFDQARTALWEKHPTARKILLDPTGRSMDSAAFARWMARAEQDARDLVFVVGGADGVPESWKPGADLLLSLSPMTLPHELARAVLAEQIYRAFATLRGHPYPR